MVERTKSTAWIIVDLGEYIHGANRNDTVHPDQHVKLQRGFDLEGVGGRAYSPVSPVRDESRGQERARRKAEEDVACMRRCMFM